MKITRKQLRKIITETLFLENTDTRKLEDDLLDFLKVNQDFFTDELKISKKMLPVFGHVAIAISGRESSFGTNPKYQWTNPLETLLSQASYYTGLGRQASVGPTQIKYSTADSVLSDKTKDKIGINQPGDLSDYLKALLTTVAIVSSNYLKAKSKGYSTNRSGDISNSKNHEKANSIFVSTGNAALDMAVTAYNAGSGIIKDYNKGKNYIPCYGPYCDNGEEGIATYGYVRDVAKYLKSKNINPKE